MDLIIRILSESKWDKIKSNAECLAEVSVMFKLALVHTTAIYEEHVKESIEPQNELHTVQSSLNTVT